MKKYTRKISVIFPAFNEEDNITNCITGAHKALGEMLESFEIIVVNDGSVDSTSAKCRELADKFSRIRIISKEKNEGYGCAIRDGIKESSGEFVFFSDSDGQFDLRELNDFLKYADNCDIVIGYRSRRADSFNRKMTSGVHKAIIKGLFGLGVRDINCAFKLFKKIIFDDIKIEAKSYSINAEILVKGKARGLDIREIAVSHFPRAGGRSKVKFSDVAGTIKDVARLYKTKKEWQKK